MLVNATNRSYVCTNEGQSVICLGQRGPIGHMSAPTRANRSYVCANKGQSVICLRQRGPIGHMSAPTRDYYSEMICIIMQKLIDSAARSMDTCANIGSIVRSRRSIDCAQQIYCTKNVDLVDFM